MYVVACIRLREFLRFLLKTFIKIFLKMFLMYFLFVVLSITLLSSSLLFPSSFVAMERERKLTLLQMFSLLINVVLLMDSKTLLFSSSSFNNNSHISISLLSLEIFQYLSHSVILIKHYINILNGKFDVIRKLITRQVVVYCGKDVFCMLY